MRPPSVGNAAIFRSALALLAASGLEGVFGSVLLQQRAPLRAPARADEPQKLWLDGTSGDREAVALVSESDAKPPRLMRSGRSSKKGDSKGRNLNSTLICGETRKVDSSTNKADRCPHECPYFAQDRADEDFCTFTCVKEEDCANMHPEKQIGDDELGVCRACIIDGCSQCDTSVLTDRCAKCQAGYFLKDGQCHFKYGGSWLKVVGAVLAALVGFVALWVVDMAVRPSCNTEAMEKALAHREKCKIHMPADETGGRRLFPLGTNMHKEIVAGPGMMLHFNFQLALIVWAVFVALVWMCFAQCVDSDLWRLGTRSFGTPRSNCILVFWGYETQQRLMWTKVAFLWIVYSATCVACVLYGIFQWREYQDIDYRTKTMKDFAAMIVGLPPLKGDRRAEEELKQLVENSTGQKMVGVSVAWNYKDHDETVQAALDADLEEKMGGSGGPREAPEMNPVRSALYNMEKQAFGTEPEPEGERSDELKETLKQLWTSPRAIAVFETEEGRDAAVAKVEEEFGLEMDGNLLELKMIDAEPDSVMWVNFGHSATLDKGSRILVGFGIIVLACAFWAIVFYAPYAYYVLTFNYENGRQPGFIVGISFSMIVVIGNAIMYEVCGRISDWVGFRVRDNREACYMIMYTIACMFNVALDFVVTYLTAETIMESLGFRTYFGVKLTEINTFTTKFETYGMQRSLAENTFTYAFPSTYLIPFLIEPIPTVLAPLWVGKLIVRSHPEVRGVTAEQWLEMLPMDMGRYADLLLNVILGILIFYFPGGYTWTLFLGMAGSHVWIYIFDYYKVLREIPACTYVNYAVEWWCQALMAPIIGIMASCLVFKSNCEPGYHCIQGPTLIGSCCAAWCLHVVVHMLVLTIVIPKFGRKYFTTDDTAGVQFKDVARMIPSSWFSANPVHCLRSKYIYEHSPPCDYHVLGKEEVMRAHPKIGCFFTNAEAPASTRERLLKHSTSMGLGP